jgi:putative membrane protein
MKELIVISIITFLTISFVLFFIIPSLSISRKLNEITRKLEQTKPNTNPVVVHALFAEEKEIKAIWKEYRKTLHLQQEIINGEMKLSGVFSTVTADAYFNPETVFEGRINSEFFKHLPGILTGLGIIGTFIGLIFGLQSFASIKLGDPQDIQRGLTALMDAVRGAFVVSAIAIK